MSVYVDDVRHNFRRMIMCHMWSESLEELLAMADKIGVARKWLQQPPKASWIHFDICISMRSRAIEAGAILTDRYGPLEFLAKRSGNQRRLDMIAECRAAVEVRKLL